MHPYEVATTLRQRAKQEEHPPQLRLARAVVESLERRASSRRRAPCGRASAPSGRCTTSPTTAARDRRLDGRVDQWPRQGVPGVRGGPLLHPLARSRSYALMALRGRAEALKVKLAGMKGAMKAASRAGAATPVRARDRVRGTAACRRVEVRQRHHRGDLLGHARGARHVAALPHRGLQLRGGAFHLRHEP